LSALHRFKGAGWTLAVAGPALAALLFGLSALHAGPRGRQIEMVPSPRENHVWVNVGNVEGHLALNSSPEGAFAPDSSALVVVKDEKVVIDSLAGGNISLDKVLQPKIKNLRDLDIQSANFLDANTLFLLGTGIVHKKGRNDHPTPLLGFRWNVQQDAQDGTVAMFGSGGGFGRPRYFPQIKHLGMYKNSSFILWSPVSRKALEVKVPELTRVPHVYSFSPDGHWLLLAQIAGGGSSNPIVVRLSEQKFVDVLSGFQETVMSMRFSKDSRKLVTASEDGKIKVWSVPDWKLLETFAGHEGPVRWAEFSPDGQWVVSGGEDKTVRIWSVKDGKAFQTLSESRAPIDTVSFSPDGNYVAATTDNHVLIWKKTATGP
jgi:WD40 repeat protein